jgi:hypothetical protein
MTVYDPRLNQALRHINELLMIERSRISCGAFKPNKTASRIILDAMDFISEMGELPECNCPEGSGGHSMVCAYNEWLVVQKQVSERL